jgi:hypothetical protein
VDALPAGVRATVQRFDGVPEGVVRIGRERIAILRG